MNCIDYQLLNKKIIEDRYPLPLVEDQLDALQNAKIFSTFDLKNEFSHVPIEELSKKYTALWCQMDTMNSIRLDESDDGLTTLHRKA